MKRLLYRTKKILRLIYLIAFETAARVGVIKRNGSRFSISDKNLDEYFIKKDGTKIDREKVLRRMIGENFTKKGYAYIFKLRGKKEE